MEYKTCPACKNESSEEQISCMSCDFPFDGTEKEKSIHIGKFISQKGVIYNADDALKKSQIILFAVSILFLINIGFNFSELRLNSVALILNMAITGIIALSAFLVKKEPYLFLILPLVMFIVLYVSNYLINPESLLQGIVLKCIILGSLIYSLYSHITAQQFKKKYKV